MTNKIIDTHAHIYLEQFDTDRLAVMQRAKDINEFLILPNIDLKSIGQVHNLAESYPNFCLPTMGLHPCSVKKDYIHVLETMEQSLTKKKYYGIGETGLDLYWDKTHFEEQKKALKIQINWAKKLQLPIILHCRDSFSQTIEIIEKEQDGNLTGVFHCFSGSVEEGKRVLNTGFYMGIGGVLTYNKSGLFEVIKQLPIEKIVIETDCPYLTPVPHRGKRNESAYTFIIAQKLAEAYQMNVQDIINITTQNARKLFNIT